MRVEQIGPLGTCNSVSYFLILSRVSLKPLLRSNTILSKLTGRADHLEPRTRRGSGTDVVQRLHSTSTTVHIKDQISWQHFDRKHVSSTRPEGDDVIVGNIAKISGPPMGCPPQPRCLPAAPRRSNPADMWPHSGRWTVVRFHQPPHHGTFPHGLIDNRKQRGHVGDEGPSLIQAFQHTATASAERMSAYI